MRKMLMPREQMKALIRERRRLGHDRHDEVWDGVYIMSPDPNIEHQVITGDLFFTLRLAIGGRSSAKVYPSLNISDRVERWTRNFRCPDICVFCPGNPAIDCGTHWCGGPDFTVEVMSPSDRSRKKLGFYASVGVRELLLVNRKPWQLELFRISPSKVLEPAGISHPETSSWLSSEVLPIRMRMIATPKGPRIELARPTGDEHWLVGDY